ncbi:hypothetical protein LCGC14_1160590 [marine sediment metagenome]|uniref:Uncharacterized protein n=1 Tax=marine sediment metagenome TaxID=412755 RepID=A0A0F9PYE0_9ZZZZ
METNELPKEIQAELAHYENSELADMLAWLQLSDTAQQLRMKAFMIETRRELVEIKTLLSRHWWDGISKTHILIGTAAGAGGFVAMVLGLAPIG